MDIIFWSLLGLSKEGTGTTKILCFRSRAITANSFFLLAQLA